MRNFILTLVLLLPFIIFAQSDIPKIPCATDKIMQQLTRDFPEVKERIALFEQGMKENAQNKRNSNAILSIPPAGSITIPVVVYIVHDGTALTNISDSQVNDQLTALNNYFLNTGIKFCLATKVNGTTPIPTVNTSDVQTTPGIIHVYNATLSNHNSTSQSALVATASPQITKDRYLRIWVVKRIDGLSSGILGYSMFPNTSAVFDGIVMRYDIFGNGNPNMLANYNLGKVLVHEIGHYLFLYHTFEGGCAANFNDCTLDGDHVCDTPRVASPNFNCVFGTNSCVETPVIGDDLSNYMDYGNNVCQTHFTTGQIDRMLAVLQFSRNLLYATENIIYTGTCGSANLLSATITPSDYSPCTSPTVATTFAAPPAATYSWNFGDAFATGSNPNTATTQTASHIYTSAANSPYTVTLTVTNNLGELRTSSEQIFVTNCTPILNANSYWYIDYASGLDFRSGKPVFDPTFPLANTANLSVNAQSDSSGNLLFYTNQRKIWDRQHNIINTTDLLLTSNSANSAQVLIVPKPPATGNTITEYYIFTQQAHNSNVADIGFRYSIVNVNSLNATMGIIKQPITWPATNGYDAATDGALLGTRVVSAVKKCNGNDYWILTTLKKGNSLYFVVYSLTSAGLTYNSERLIVNGNSSLLDTGGLDVAPNGNKLFLWNFYGSNCLLYDFNKAEGIVDSTFTLITIPQTANTYGQMQGSSFSPDSNLLYVTDYYAKRVYQFNINSINIDSTRREVGSSIAGPWAMQLGPDKKLYVAMGNDFNNQKQLSVIHNPNAISTPGNPNACGFSVNGPKPTSFVNRVGPGLPNNIDAKQETAYFTSNTSNVICKYITGCNTYKFFPNVCGISFNWTFTNITTATSFTTNVTDPIYTFAQNGTYIVTLKDSNNVLLGTSSPIVITTAIAPVITGSTTACLTRPNESITNNSVALNTGESVIWSITGGGGNITGAINSQPSVNINWTSLPGTITLTRVNAAGCTTITNTVITSFCTPLGTEDNSNHGLQVSPNPSHGIFTIHSTNPLGKVSLQVFDIRGRVVFSQKDADFNTNEKTIDLSGCQSGMYILKLIGSDFNLSYKLLKE